MIYFSQVLQSKQDKLNKYLICFYIKMEGYIKYLGIEFLYYFEESQPLFIENMYLVQNLDLLQTLMGITDGINFQFYKIYEDSFFRLLAKPSFQNYTKFFMPEENNQIKLTQPLQTIHLNDPDFVYEKVFFDLSKKSSEKVLVQAWPEHLSYLYNMISSKENQFCCIKLTLASEANLKLKDIIYSQDLSTALFFCLFDTRPTVSVVQGVVKITDVTFISSSEQSPKIEFKTMEKIPSDLFARLQTTSDPSSKPKQDY